jgi:hypothetical protein
MYIRMTPPIPNLPYSTYHLFAEIPLYTHRALWFSNFNIGYTEHTPTGGGTSASEAETPKNENSRSDI